MRVVKYLVLLILIGVWGSLSLPSPAFAQSSVPAYCSKIKQQMVLSCTRKSKLCPRHSKALNKCLRKSVSSPISLVSPVIGAVCTMVYQPVCALNTKSQLQIFGNSCEAKNASASEVTFEQCQVKASVT